MAALGHGIRVLHASINRREVALESPGEYIERGRHHGAIAIGYAVTALAGQAAAPETGLSRSDELLLEHALFLGSWSDAPDEMRRALFSLANNFVVEHRGQIENLAIVLVQRRTLSSVEIDEVLLGAEDNDKQGR